MEREKKIGECKAMMIKELTEQFKSDSNVYFSDYTGLKADEINELRRAMKGVSSQYLVVKNSIAHMALENAGLKNLVELVTGSTGMTFGGDDPVATARILARFGKGHGALKIRSGYLDGEIVGVEKIKYLASLPGREELIAKIVYGIKSPISGFVCVLGNTLKGLVYALQAIKEKKGG